MIPGVSRCQSTRAWRVLTLLALSCVSLFGAEEGHAEKTASNLSPGLQTILLWVNFAILAGFLAWLIKKYGRPFFSSRSERIQRELVEAAKIRKDAEVRSADVDRRLANLQADLDALKAESRRELQSLEDHQGSKTAAEIARIQSNAEQEIAAAGKAARLELKRYSAELAVNLAGEKIRTRMTPGAQQELVSDFVHQLDSSGARAQAN
jgi:F-type H+-transporting ATPase subunit b